jgi:hypothetical protein
MALDYQISEKVTAQALVSDASARSNLTPQTNGLGLVEGGGTVTQITSASTGVTLNKPCGQIVTVALTTAAGAETIFTVTNSFVTAKDVPVVSISTYAGAGTPIVATKNTTTGAFDIVITNLHASAALDALLTLNFVVLKSCTA